MDRSCWRKYTEAYAATTLAQGRLPGKFFWQEALQDATALVTKCEACQFHAKQIHQPAQALQTIPLSWPFSVWGLDILGPFPRAVGGFEYLYVAIDKFTKWPEVEAVRKVTAQSAIKFFKGLVCRFGVPTGSSPTTAHGSQAMPSCNTLGISAVGSVLPPWHIHGATAKRREQMLKSCEA